MSLGMSLETVQPGGEVGVRWRGKGGAGQACRALYPLCIKTDNSPTKARQPLSATKSTPSAPVCHWSPVLLALHLPVTVSTPSMSPCVERPSALPTPVAIHSPHTAHLQMPRVHQADDPQPSCHAGRTCATPALAFQTLPHTRAAALTLLYILAALGPAPNPCCP